MSRFIEETVQGKETPEDRKEKLLRVFKKSVLTASELRSRKVEKRPKLLGEWLRKGDLGFIFAPRGRGKTWFSMAVAKALAIGAGAKVGVWEASEAQTVLYCDGEMALDDTQSREIALDGDAGNRLHFLHHSVIFEDAEETLNLTDKSAQDAITATLLHLKATVLVMDNLSSLFYGLKENENDSWEAVLPWLLELRRRGITIVIVHHAGTNESRMRGATKREDACHWVIRLDASVHGDAEEGARFCTAFTKNRNCPGKDAQSVEFYFKPNGLHIGKVDVVCSIVDSLERFRICIRDMKLESASEIAEEMNSSRGYVSKLAQKAEKEGWCKIQDRKYTYNEPGCPPF
jgi:putative DNA primase/helicase